MKSGPKDFDVWVLRKNVQQCGQTVLRKPITQYDTRERRLDSQVKVERRLIQPDESILRLIRPVQVLPKEDRRRVPCGVSDGHRVNSKLPNLPNVDTVRPGAH